MVAKVGGTLVLAFLASVVLLAIIGVVSYRAVSTLIANNEIVTHTENVLEELQEIRSLVLQVETDARGFLLTGVDVYKSAYENDLKEIPKKIHALKTKTQDNVSHQERFGVLEKAVQARLDLLQEYVDRRQVLGATVIPPGQGPEGKRRMDAVIAALDDIRTTERILLEQRLAQSRQSTQQLLVTLGLSFLGSFGLICLVFYLALRYIRARQLSESKLSTAHDALEDRVRERTAELAASNMELERSNRELQDFAFVASHDLQEPLRKIQAFGDRLRTVQGPQFSADSMHTRKQAMCDRADGFIALPGGYGTLDEVMEILTWNQIGTIAKPVAFLDVPVGGAPYFEHLLRFFDTAVDAGLVKPAHRTMAQVATTVVDAIGVATGPAPDSPSKWTDPSVR